MRLIALASLCISACALVGAEKVDFADLRIGLGAGPMPNDQKGDLSGTPASDGYDGGPGVSASVGVHYGSLSPLGLLWGGEWNYVSGAMDMTSQDGVSLAGTGTPSAQFSQSALILNGGFGLATSSQSHLSLVALAGLAWVTLDSKATTGTSKGRGNGTLFGGRVGWYYTGESRWQCGIEADWTKMEADLITDYATNRYDSTTINSGVSGRAILGYRF
jgi:hypothetical protein